MSLKIEKYEDDGNFSQVGKLLEPGDLSVNIPNNWSDGKREEYILRCLSKQESEICIVRDLEKGQEITSEIIENAVFICNLNKSNGAVEIFLKSDYSWYGTRFRFSHI